MLFDYSWLQTFFQKKLPAIEKLAEILKQHSFDVEIVGKNIDVSIFPNRASDYLNYQGLAREIGAVLNYKVSYSKLAAHISKKTKDFKISVKDQEDCSRYILMQWSDVKISDSTAEIKKRLNDSGLKSINNAVDIANYLMLEIGQPVHVFDADKIDGSEIEIRRAKKKEKFVSLDNKTYYLSEEILVIADQGGPLAIAGIKGGLRAEVSSSTKNILVEAADFNPQVIRKSSRLLDLKTDASLRFEYGIDPNLAESAQYRFIALGKEILKPKSIAHIADFYPIKNNPKSIILDLTKVRQLLGVSIPTSKITDIFKRLNFQFETISNHKLKVIVPTWRPDIKMQEDLVEEISRIYGYDTIPALAPRSILIPSEVNRERLWKRNIKEFLNQLGLSESRHYSFVSGRDLSNFGYDAKDAIELENPTSAHYQYLRFSLLPNLIRALKENTKRFNQVSIFEVGKIFWKPSQERESLAGVLYDHQSGDDSFYELKGIIESLLERIGITDAWFDNYQAEDYFGGEKTWHPNHRSEIKIGKDIIGFIGEIHPILADNLSLPESVFAFEIDLESLIHFASDQQEYQPISLYPAVIRDLSIVVPNEISIEEVIYETSRAGGELVRDVDLIDIYCDDNLNGQKSITLRVVYQSMTNNLSANDVRILEEKIINVFHKLNWYLRQ